MPLIQVNLAKGRSKEQKRKLLESITQAVNESIDAPLSSIRIWISEFPKDEFMIAGELMEERESRLKRTC